METEALFTTIYEKNKWGSDETRSGPSSTLSRTESLRTTLPELFTHLGIKSILDCGCGDWNWMKTVDLSNISSYIGVDIVNPLLTTLQASYSTPTIVFEKLDVLHDPPETADLWFARDLLCLYTPKEYLLFFQNFIKSNSKYLAITSIQTDDPYTEYAIGGWQPVSLLNEPFELPEPLLKLDDGHQWFRKKDMLVYDRQQILEWTAIKASKLVGVPQEDVHDKQDRNAHLVSNIPLRKITLYDRKE